MKMINRIWDIEYGIWGHLDEDEAGLGDIGWRLRGNGQW
jgi:hypothetical protein